MARYFAEIVGGVVDRIVVGADSDTTTTIGTLLGGTWIETADPDASPTAGSAYPALGLSSSLVQPPVIAGGTVFGAPARIVNTTEYSSWPYANLHYDTTNSKLWLIYSSGSDHVDNTTAGTFYVEIDTTTDTAGTPIEFAPPNATPLGAVCHSSFIAPNGDYVALIMRRNSSQEEVFDEVWRSTDAGANWTNEGEPVDSGSEVIPTALLSPCGSIITATGRMLSFIWERGTNRQYPFYSDDNGATWTLGSVITSGIADTTPLEPAFFQVPAGRANAGRIIAIIRAGLTGSQNNPLSTYSDDNGATWAALTEMPDRIVQHSNPAALIYHEDDDLIEYFGGSRVSPAGRITRMLATPENAVAGTWSGQELIVGGTADKNFGYPAAVRVGSKVYLCWYAGNDNDCDIWMAVGTRS